MKIKADTSICHLICSSHSRITLSDLPPGELELEGAEGSDRSEDIWTPERLHRLDRQFNIDIMPKVIF